MAGLTGSGTAAAAAAATLTPLSDAQRQQQVKLAVEAFRASCLSNLADVCMTLEEKVKPYAHRICSVVISLLHLEGSQAAGERASGSRVGQVMPDRVLIEVVDAETFGVKEDADGSSGIDGQSREPVTVQKKGKKNLPRIHRKIGAGRSVRRAGVFVLRSVLRAARNNVLHILNSGDILAQITTVLQFLESSDSDPVTRFHAKLALENLNEDLTQNLTPDYDVAAKHNGQRNVFKISLERAFKR